MKCGRVRRVENCCFHITHRCQERRFLLRFQRDRRNFVKRLAEASEKYTVDVLDYLVTSNHVHLLLWTKIGSTISDMMRYLQGTTGRDFNRRKNREGAYWSGRYHPTLIQNGAHLTRCLFYIAMNMVRAGAVDHPKKWECSGYHEISGDSSRNSLVNLERLQKCIGYSGTMELFHKWYLGTLAEQLATGSLSRDPLWTESAAVGDSAWIQHLSNRIAVGKLRIIKISETSFNPLAKESTSYGLKVANRVRTGLIRDLKI